MSSTAGKKYVAKPGHRVHWDDVDPDDKGSFKKKEDALEETQQTTRKLDDLPGASLCRGQTRAAHRFAKPSIPAAKMERFAM